MMVVFPWPPKNLSPNARVHWSKKAKSAKAYKLACWALAKEAKLKIDWDGFINVTLEFIPPTNRRRDFDNTLASMKAGLDGLAAALGVDDYRFRIAMFFGPTTGGMVKVTVTQP